MRQSFETPQRRDGFSGKAASLTPQAGSVTTKKDDALLPFKQPLTWTQKTEQDLMIGYKAARHD